MRISLGCAFFALALLVIYTDPISLSLNMVEAQTEITATNPVFNPPLPTPANESEEIEEISVAPEAASAAAASVPVPRMREKSSGRDAAYPVRLIIPSIGLDSPIQYVGTNEKGEMDVPSGETQNVGWYKNGTIPGKTGSAVLAAHVFAAFSELKNLAPGSDVYIETKGGEMLRFTVVDAEVYTLGALSPSTLFSRRDAKRLNLITCAGAFIPSMDTYDHRLVVYTKLVG